jgi:hypothetical protein
VKVVSWFVTNQERFPELAPEFLLDLVPRVEKLYKESKEAKPPKILVLGTLALE